MKTNQKNARILLDELASGLGVDRASAWTYVARIQDSIKAALVESDDPNCHD